MYDVALFLHLIGVVTLFGLVALEMTSLVRAPAAPDVRSLRAALLNVPVIGRLIPVAIVFIVGAGLYLLSQGGDTGTEFSWGSAWIDVALGIVGTLLVVGPGVNGRRLEALHAAAHEASGDAVDARIDRMRHDPVMHHGIWYATLETVALLFLMTNKPSLAVSVVVAVAAAVASVPAARLTLRRRQSVRIPGQPAAVDALDASVSVEQAEASHGV